MRMRPDFVSRQFIVLTKKFRKDLRKYLTVLNSALNKQAEAIRQSHKTSDGKQRSPPEITIHNHYPESIEIAHNPKDTRDERNYKRAMFFVTALTLGAIVVYADLVYWQYRETIKATGAAQQAATAAGKSADTQTIAVHLDQRAWIVPSPKGTPTFTVGKEITTPLAILNTGKTPALGLNSDVAIWLLRKNELPEFVYTQHSGHPVYKIKGGTIFPNEPDASTSTINYAVLEHGEKFSHRTAKPVILTTEVNDNLKLGDDLWIAVFGQFTYNDVFGTPHWTHFCWVVSFPGTISKPVQPGKQVCSNYNDIDRNDLQPATK